jgi:hypothetical protein
MRAIFSLLSCLAFAACDSGVANLFGNSVLGSGPSAVEVARASAETPLADQILSLDAAPTPDGLIVSAVTLPPTQGFWDARLVRVPTDDPSLYLMEFRLLPPIGAGAAGPQPSREVLSGTVLTNRELAGIRTIAVRGARDSRSVPRR